MRSYVLALWRCREHLAAAELGDMQREAWFHACAGKGSRTNTTIAKPTSGRLDPALIPDREQQVTNLAIARLNAQAIRTGANLLDLCFEEGIR